MIPVFETEDGFIPATGNPIVTSKDGQFRAPLAVILHHSWTEEERAKFGVFMAEPLILTETQRIAGDVSFEKGKDGKIREVRPVEDRPDILRGAILTEIEERAGRLGGIVLCGLAFPVVIMPDGQISCGCETHSAKDWAKFTSSDLVRMGGKEAARFWEIARDPVLKLAGVE